MGIHQSKQSSLLMLKLPHQHLSNPTHFTHNGKQYLKINCNVEEMEYERWNQTLNHYGSTNQQGQQMHGYPQHVLLPVRKIFSNNGICSSIGTAEIFYQNYCHLVSEQLYHRRQRKSQFKQPQIWMLLLFILKAERQMQVFGQILGDIRPNKIFLNQQGGVKVAGRNSWPGGLTAFQLGVQKIAAFISPQDMTALSIGVMQPSLSMPSEMFSIGLTLLCLANLKDYEGLYNLREKKIDVEKLEEALVEMKKNKAYSEVLRGVITNLSSIAPQNRMDLDELWSTISKHQAKITSKKPFAIDNAPQKLHNEIAHLRSFVIGNPMLFATPQLLSQVGGSGLTFPSHLDVHRVTPEYVFSQTKTIINRLQ